ncbi:MAG: class I SAM-dependent methyltransferase [Candidatus Sumerlaeia bacterium]
MSSKPDIYANYETLQWLRDNIEFRKGNSAEFWYDYMQSQSGECLPVVYQPFDSSKRSHICDRGQILDFAAHAGGGRVLDFGPGDGWPSLPLAPLVDEVIGVDGSEFRVSTCEFNARKLGVENARFRFLEPGLPLPFGDEEFDLVCAAAAIEQTPNPDEILREFLRVLKSGGCLRMHYESLDLYGPRTLCVGHLMDCGVEASRFVIFDRHPDMGRADHYGLAFAMPVWELRKHLFGDASDSEIWRFAPADISPEALVETTSHMTDAARWSTFHPDCRAWIDRLLGLGFAAATPRQNGGDIAGQWFDMTVDEVRPISIPDTDRVLRPLVEAGVQKVLPADAPDEKVWAPWITATKAEQSTEVPLPEA